MSESMTTENNQSLITFDSGLSYDPSRLVVMKFGGTSVATEAGRQAIADRVLQAKEEGIDIVLVVSALGRYPEPYATDTLLSLVDAESITPHESDLLMSVGETISSVVIASVLRANGIEARALSGFDAGIASSTVDGCATIETINVGRIVSLLSEGITPVICGFQGNDEDGSVKTLGRGGSDTSACALGVALKASSVDIFSDVDGVMSADPRVVPTAQVLDQISAEELFQMATRGSKIVHAPAAELALNAGVRMKVRNTFNDTDGTLVINLDDYRPQTVATGVSCRKGIARVRLRLPYGPGLPSEHIEVQARAFRMLADAGISVDMATPFTDRLVFVVDSPQAYQAAELLRTISQDMNILDGLAAVTLVGSGMQGVPGIMADIADALYKAGVDMLQVSDSETSVTVLVREDFSDAAVRALHDRFAL